MDPEQWKRVKQVFEEARGLGPEQRCAFLDQRAGEDQELRSEVNSLLAGLDAAPGILDRSAMEFFEELADVSLPEDEQPHEGLEIGDWVLLEPIAQGGMGTVWLGRSRRDPARRVAVKFLRRELDSVPMLRRFSRERRALDRLDHPNIARLIDAGATASGRPFLVMQYVVGIPIDQYCRQQRLGVRERIELFQIVCRTVDHAHRHLLVHRDIKPANILVRGDGQPVLLDFGVAKLLDEKETTGLGLTTQHAVPITPEFAAPEQISGGLVTPATDVYALGVLLFRLLTGGRPYDLTGASPLQIERIICERAPARPSQSTTNGGGSPSPGLPRGEVLRRRLRGDLDRIVAHALSKEPERRYDTPRALAEDLGRYLRGEPILARPPSAGYLALKAIRKQPLAAGALAAVFVLLVLTVVVFVVKDRAVNRTLRYAEKRMVLNEMIGRALGADFAGAGSWLDGPDELDSRRLALLEAYLETPEVQKDPWVRAGYMHFLGMATLPFDQERGTYFVEQAARERRSIHPPDHPEIAESEHGLGILDHLAGRYREALDHFLAALAIREESFGEESQQVAETLKFLGMTQFHAGELEAARRSLERSQEIYAGLHGGAIDPHAANHLAELAAEEGKLDEAIALMDRAIAAEIERYGHAGHPDLASSHNNRGIFLVRQQRYAEAAEAFERALLVREEFTPDDQVVLARNRSYVWRARALAGQRERAREELAALAEGLAGVEEEGARELRTEIEALIADLAAEGTD